MAHCRMTARCFPLFALAISLGSPVVWAQVTPVGLSPPDAEALIRQAAELRRAQRLTDALELLHRANALAPGPRPVALSGLIEQALGRYGEAYTHITEALAVPDDLWVRRSRAALESAVTELRGHVGDLTVTGGSPGASVVVNDTVRGTLPLAHPITVTAGNVTLEVRQPGYLTVTRNILVVAGTLISERVNMVRASGHSDDATPVGPAVLCARGTYLREGLCYARPGAVTDPTVVGLRWMSWIGFGLAATAGMVATGLWADGNSSLNTYLGTCGGSTAPPSCLGAYRQTVSLLSERATLVDVTWGIAGVAAAISAVGFVLLATLGHPDADNADQGPHLAALPGGLGLTW